MADGLLCKHCGWQESDHIFKKDIDIQDRRAKRRGYKKSLSQCRGFVMSQKDRVAARDPKNRAMRDREEDSYPPHSPSIPFDIHPSLRA